MNHELCGKRLETVLSIHILVFQYIISYPLKYQNKTMTHMELACHKALYHMVLPGISIDQLKVQCSESESETKTRVHWTTRDLSIQTL